MTMTQSEAGEWAIGVDVGGTKVAAGFVDAHGKIQQHTRVPMNSRGTAEEGLAAVTNAIDELLKLLPQTDGAAKRIGICAHGHGAESSQCNLLAKLSACGGNRAPLRRHGEIGK